MTQTGNLSSTAELIPGATIIIEVTAQLTVINSDDKQAGAFNVTIQGQTTQAFTLNPGTSTTIQTGPVTVTVQNTGTTSLKLNWT